MQQPRRAPRVELKMEMVWNDPTGLMTGSVVDISSTGVFLETSMPAPPGSVLQLNVMGKAHEDLQDLTGQVVRSDDFDPENNLWTRPEGMAVTFDGLSDTQLLALASLIETQQVYSQTGVANRPQRTRRSPRVRYGQSRAMNTPLKGRLASFR